MTGDEFSTALRQLSLTQKQLAEHWDLARSTIVRISNSPVVPPVYADAIRYLLVRSSVDALQMATTNVKKGVFE